MEGLWERYTPASRRLVDALFDGDEPAAEDLEAVRATLDAYLRGLGLDADVRQDIIQDTYVLLISGVQRGVVDREGNLAAFIRTIARNRCLDAGRARARRPTVDSDRPPEPISDDGVARLLDQLVSAEQVQAGLNAAAAAGELDLVTFVSEWLTFAQQIGETPTLRAAADALGTNHMHVSRELARFSAYLPNPSVTDAEGQP